MWVIKKINNNVAICRDNNQRELIAFGKAIGFHEMPYEITDMALIDQTYYAIDASYVALLNEIPEVIFDISTRTVNYARAKLSYDFSNNLIFALADHINFAIERQKKHLYIRNQMVYDIQYFYEKEMEIGETAVRLIWNELKIRLPKEEAGNIALYFINAKAMTQAADEKENDDYVIEDITCMVEDTFDLTVNRRDFNYSRFVTHLQYLLKRVGDGIAIQSDNKDIFTEIRNSYPEIYKCAVSIAEYLAKTRDWQGTDEELLYLMLHINRLIAREDCHQQ